MLHENYNMAAWGILPTSIAHREQGVALKLRRALTTACAGQTR